jgi:hypothetical protein
VDGCAGAGLGAGDGLGVGCGAGCWGCCGACCAQEIVIAAAIAATSRTARECFTDSPSVAVFIMSHGLRFLAREFSGKIVLA